MAKKSVRESIESEKIDFVVNNLYDSGVLQSTIFHTVLFLIMALTFYDAEPIKKIHLSLSFGSDQGEQVVYTSEIPDITEALEIVQDPKTDVASDMSSIETDAQIDISVEILEEPVTSSSVAETISETDLMKEISSTVPTEEPKDTTVETTASTPTQTGYSVADFRPPAGSSMSNPASMTRTNNRRGFGNSSQNGMGQGIGFGTGSDIGARLSKAGAKTGDIQVSISWDTVDDIDVHVMYRDPVGSTNTISWMQRRDVYGGMLDVDMNAHPYVLNPRPVENIFWPHGASPKGEYIVAIHFFRDWSGASRVPVLVVIKNGSHIETINHVAIFGYNPQQVYRFTRK